MSEIIFKIASTEEEIIAARNIRKNVFVLEQGIPEELDTDEDDERSIHLLALGIDPRFIGTGRLTINQDAGVLSRISVIKQYRNRGIGKLILLELERIARQKGLRSLTLAPHEYLENFYATLGYKKNDSEKIVGKYKLLSMTKLI